MQQDITARRSAAGGKPWPAFLDNPAIVLPLIGVTGFLLDVLVVSLSPVALGLLLLAAVPWIVKCVRGTGAGLTPLASDEAAAPRPVAGRTPPPAERPVQRSTPAAPVRAAQPTAEPARPVAAQRSRAPAAPAIEVARLPGLEERTHEAAAPRPSAVPPRPRARPNLGAPDL